MIFAFAISFASLITPAPGKHLALGADCSERLGPADFFSRTFPQDVAFMPDGGVIFVERAGFGCDHDTIVIADKGKRRTIERPMPTARSINGHNYWISRIRVARDGTIFATLSDSFSGAYIGVRRSVFVYRDARWTRLNSWCRTIKDRCEDGNEDIGAAYSANLYVVVHDRDDSAVGAGYAMDPASGSPQAALVDRGSVHRLGAGTSTAMNSRWIAGYSDGFQHRLPPQALRWHGDSRTSLGTGAAFAVATDGTTVGDDRSRWDDEGYPTRWDVAKKEQLSGTHGSAYAISGNIVVGATDDGGFIAVRQTGSWTTTRVATLPGASGSVLSLFALTNDRALALVRDGNNSLSLAVVTLRSSL